MTDPEIQAMQSVSAAIADLDLEAQRRVLRWASQRFLGNNEAAHQETLVVGGTQAVAAPFSDFVDLYHAANPRTLADKALVAGYWFQQVKGSQQLRAQDLNGALRDLGHGIQNVTDALRTLERHKPALVRQTGKAGRSQQARKSYKLTQEGVARAQGLLSGPQSEGPLND